MIRNDNDMTEIRERVYDPASIKAYTKAKIATLRLEQFTVSVSTLSGSQQQNVNPQQFIAGVSTFNKEFF